MLTRQKIVLSMLRHAGRPVLRIELMNWCFLLRHESTTGGGSAFYDFVPCKLGPFSFAIDQEIGKLESMGHVRPDADDAWNLNPELLTATALVVGRAIEQDIKEIVRNLGSLSRDELLDHIDRRHPAYTVNSTRQKLARRPKADVAVYTAGYEGISIDRFLNLLVESGIERVIDVRNNPTARRYGFHKSTLSRLLNQLDIAYCHFAQLGIRSEVRQRFSAAGNRAGMFDEYEVTTIPTQSEAVRAVSELIAERPSVLVCMESDPSCCHRSRLAKPVSKLTGLPIVHPGQLIDPLRE